MPAYEVVAESIRARIRACELRPGDRVPSTRALVRDHRVALATASRALAVLAEQGWVVARPRVATVVADVPPVPGAAPAGGVAAPCRRELLDRATVVAGALRVADAEGLGAVSMRRLAAESGVPTMSVYGAVRGKDDLVAAMIETSFAEDPFPVAAPPGWRARLEVSARRQWRIYRRRPWLARVINLTRPQGLGCLLDLADWDLAALEELALDGSERLDRHILLCTFVRGVAVSLDAETEAAADTGVDADTWIDRDPHLVRALAGRSDGALGRAGAYDLDLDRLLELGLASLLDECATHDPGAAARGR